MNHDLDFENFYNQQLAPIVSQLNSKKKLRFRLKMGIPLIILIFIIIQFIRLDMIGGIFSAIGITLLGSFIYFILNQALFTPMLKDIEHSFHSPIIETFYPQLTIPKNKQPFGLYNSGLFEKNPFDYKRDAVFKLLLENGDQNKSYQCSVLQIRIGKPNSSGDAYDWKNIFRGCFVVHKINTPLEASFTIRPKHIKRAYLSKKKFKNWVERTTGNEAFDEDYKLMTPSNKTDISIVL